MRASGCNHYQHESPRQSSYVSERNICRFAELGQLPRTHAYTESSGLPICFKVQCFKIWFKLHNSICKLKDAKHWNGDMKWREQRRYIKEAIDVPSLLPATPSSQVSVINLWRFQSHCLHVLKIPDVPWLIGIPFPKLVVHVKCTFPLEGSLWRLYRGSILIIDFSSSRLIKSHSKNRKVGFKSLSNPTCSFESCLNS